MKFVKKEVKYVVKTHEDNDGYEADETYEFDSESAALDFCDGKVAITTSGKTVWLNYYTVVTEVFSKIEYDLDYELDDE